ncbi:MAG: GWxTD domain-containing protein [Bacteroidetes bacterium]|nr:GWxTD domain-containing protein [Rhodothermia bacterium]MCS7155375.1 GWxTD domain-containing protein [Bacteroidota bacterium]MCX7907532.1 GWxTD domain-containing protein [Bacteroidota bacterium]MDW8138526.1 GWxTD domain-containing protein [Bacteroidota bacterium]MDW8284537.1 GWxTD domain-containing protein [Bacteroidota bacterium]
MLWALACIGLDLPARAQDGELEAETLVVRHTDGRPRLDVFLRLSYSKLTFFRQGTGFQARYEATVELYRLNGRGQPQGLAESRTQERLVSAFSYAQTQQENAYDYLQLVLFPAPGRYLVQARVEDRHTGRQYARRVEVLVRDFGAEAFAMSDLLILDRFDEARQVLYPNVANEVGQDQSECLLFFELYTRWPRRVQVSYEVHRPRPLLRPTVRSFLGRSPSTGPEVVFQSSESRLLGPIRNQFVVRIPLDALKPERYTVRLLVRDEEGRELGRAEKTLRVRWTGLEAFIADLDQAIAQLVYLAKPAEIRAIQEAPTRAERYERFRAFWKKRDPTPGTERNELMEEYYQRVWYANRQFSGLEPGWKTDRGMVFILFGEPDAIDHHPFAYNAKPYQIWYYYSLGRRFIFVDQSGFGDYRLLIPIWDERNRM